MSFSLFARVVGVSWCVAAVFSPAVYGQSSAVPFGSEYFIAGGLPGDQVRPQAGITAAGGYVVWEDNATDGNGLGISAMRVDGSLSGSLAPFRVNQIGSGDQERAQLTLLTNGGAAFIWQGGRKGFQRVYARFRSSTNTWVTGDIAVSAFTNFNQSAPAIATLRNGNVIGVWASFNQRSAGSLNDIYAQILTSGGQKIGAEFPVNQFSANNQRSPAVASLAGGGFVLVWISEQQRSQISGGTNYFSFAEGAIPYPEIQPWATPSVDVYARLYDANGTPLGDEFVVNTGTNVCAQPAVVGSSDGGFVIVWMERDVVVPNNGWDVCARSFTFSGGGSAQRRVNTQLYGDQYAPQLAEVAGQFLVVWNSLGQDGSREGVYAQFLNSDGTLSGAEFRVNSTTVGSQLHPAVASNGSGSALVLWASYAGFGRGFDLYGQRLAGHSLPLAAPAAPTVHAVDASALRVSWPPVGGLNVAHYEVFVDDASSATAIVTNTSWILSGLSLNSTHAFQLAYVLGDGRRSPRSATAYGTTRDTSGDPLPFDSIVDNQLVGGGASSGSTSNVLRKMPFPKALESGTNGTRLTFAAVQGVYNGLFYNPENVDANAGAFTAKVTSKGSFSAKLQLGAQTYSFSGLFNSAGKWGPMPVGGKKGATPLMVELHLDLYGKDQIAGRVATGKWSADLLALRAGFGKASATPFAGTYTFVIPGNANAVDSPGGVGIGNLKVDAAGNVQLNGTLADGSTFSQKTTLSKDNIWPVYSVLYRGNGVVLGWVGMGSVTNYDFYGPTLWVKQGIAGTPFYPAGFTNLSFVAGSSYRAVSGTQLLENAKLVFNGGYLDASLEQAVGMQGKKAVAQGGGVVSLSFTPATGLFQGAAIDPGTGQNLPFQGVLFQKYNIGLGYFLGANQSGHLYFSPNP